jgi:regulator of chromosome condensation
VLIIWLLLIIKVFENHLGKIYTWGVGEQGQLGRKVTPRQLVESSLTPRTINFKPYRMTAKFLSAYCGAYHTFLIHETHSVFAFGLNNYGQLGCGDTDEHTNPELVEGIKDKIAMVSGGMHHSLVLTEKGI